MKTKSVLFVFLLLFTFGCKEKLNDEPQSVPFVTVTRGELP